MIDHRRRQLDKATRERRELIAEHITFEQFQTNAKAKRYPTGSTYAWAAECVFGPQGSSKKDKNNDDNGISRDAAAQGSGISARALVQSAQRRTA